MAYTDTPSKNVEQNQKINLMATSHRRLGQGEELDYSLMNGVFEFDRTQGLKDEFRGIQKRDGVQVYLPAPNTDTRLGFYYWDKWNVNLLFFGNNLFVYSGLNNSLIFTASTPYTNTSPSLGITEYLYDTGEISLIVTNGTTLIEIKTTDGVTYTQTTGTDPDMPVPHNTKIVFMNGYLFLIKSGTADIYNSDLNAPLAFTSGDFISAESFPDGVVSIVRLNTYIAAFGSSSIELFYDAANVSGSPLKKYDISVRKIGLLSTVCEYENQLIFVGKSFNTPPKVYIMEDLRLQEINDPVIVRWLASLSSNDITVSIIQHTGHCFFVISAGNQTWQYDLEFKTWSKLNSNFINGFPIENSFVQKGKYNSIFTFKESPGIYTFTQGYGLDDLGIGNVGIPYIFEVYTEKTNFNTYRPKFGGRLRIHCDTRSASNEVLNVRWSDDDYQSFTNFRTLLISNLGSFMYRLGYFIDRAWNIRYIGAAPLRIYDMELDFTLGTN